jgi:hypothetical protein
METRWLRDTQRCEDRAGSLRTDRHAPTPPSESEPIFPVLGVPTDTSAGAKIHRELMKVRNANETADLRDAVYQAWSTHKEEYDFSVQRVVSQSGPHATAWKHANLNNPSNILHDDVARDAYFIIIGMPVVIPAHPTVVPSYPSAQVCWWCNTAIKTPLQDHAVNCTHTYLNAVAGNAVERAVVESLAAGTQVLSRQDCVTDGFLFTHQDPTDSTEYRSDCTIFHQAREIHVDVTVSFTHARCARNRTGDYPVSSAMEKQEIKRRNYERKLVFAEDSLVAFGLDASGGWSSEALKLIRDIASQRKLQRRGTWEAYASKDVPLPTNPETRRMAETISIAMVKASALFMQPVRTGRLYNGLTWPEAKERGAIRTVRRHRAETVGCFNTATADPHFEAALLAQIQAEDPWGLAQMFDDSTTPPTEHHGRLPDDHEWMAIEQAIHDEVSKDKAVFWMEAVGDAGDGGGTVHEGDAAAHTGG